MLMTQKLNNLEGFIYEPNSTHFSVCLNENQPQVSLCTSLINCMYSFHGTRWDLWKSFRDKSGRSSWSLLSVVAATILIWTKNSILDSCVMKRFATFPFFKFYFIFCLFSNLKFQLLHIWHVFLQSVCAYILLLYTFLNVFFVFCRGSTWPWREPSLCS